MLNRYNSNHTHDMASRVRYAHDSGSFTDDDPSRRPEDSQNDGKGLPAHYCPDWRFLQSVFDLRKPHLPIFKCCLHSDAKGK